MSAEPQTEPCCLPNKIIKNPPGMSWTIDTPHHNNCPNARKDGTK
jgi:hypothetical protein